MQIKNFKIPFFFLLLGLCWAIGNDRVISFLAEHQGFGITHSVRALNDFIFVIVAAIYLYYHIKRERKKLTVSEQQYRGLFISNPNPMWIYELDSLKFIEVNEAAIMNYGYSRKEFLEMTIKDIRPANELIQLENALAGKKIKLGYDHFWNHQLKSGEVITVSVTSNQLTFNGMECNIVMSTDVSDLVNYKSDLEKAYQTEKALNDALEENIVTIKQASYQNHRMAEVINKIKNLVFFVSDKGRITWVNQAFIDFTGYTREEVYGKRPKEVLYGPNTDVVEIREMVETLGKAEFFTTEMINYKKNREEYWTEIHVSPIFDQQGEFDFFVSVENVITERKEKEAKLNLQYLAFREIAWKTSHEMRKPLASILSLATLLSESYTKEVRDELLKLIYNSSIELDVLVRENTTQINLMEEQVNPSPSNEKDPLTIKALD